jgi:hypothetical protein
MMETTNETTSTCKKERVVPSTRVRTKKDPKFKEDMVALNKILIKGEVVVGTEDALLEWYRSACPAIINSSRNRLVSGFLDLGNLDSAEVLCRDLDLVADSGALILMIRYYLGRDDLSAAEAVYQDALTHTRKRHATLIMFYMFDHGQYERALHYYVTYLIPQYAITSEDITEFLAKDVPYDIKTTALDLVLGQPIVIGVPENMRSVVHVKEEGNTADGQLEVLDFTPKQVDSLMTSLKKVFSMSGLPTNVDPKVHYDYVVDGANVLFFHDRKITLAGYTRVTSMLKKLLAFDPDDCQILLVLHQRHFRPEKSKWSQAADQECKLWSQLKGVTICETPKGFCDDYYSLLNSFPRLNTMLITNDQFRDHIYTLSDKDGALDLVGQWRREKVIEYNFDRGRGEPILLYPMRYSFRIQRISRAYYVPIYGSITKSGGSSWFRLGPSEPEPVL